MAVVGGRMSLTSDRSLGQNMAEFELDSDWNREPAKFLKCDYSVREG